MSQNILITGAAGYIGGSVLAAFISQETGALCTATLHAAVRSDEQVQALSKLGINIVKVDLDDEGAVRDVVLNNKIDIVVHTATSILPRPAAHLITALGERRKATGGHAYYIHTGIATMYSVEGGWKDGEVRDTDAIYEYDKEIEGMNPARQTSNVVVEQAAIHGVKSFNIVLPQIYGRGTGEWRKLSVNYPAFIRTSIEHKIVHKFDVDSNPPATHISDITTLYTLLTSACLQGTPISSGRSGYYFAVAHRAPQYLVMDLLARGLHERGLVSSPTARVWPSYDAAAKALGWPALYIKAMGTFSGELIPVNPGKVGWRPQWDEKRFLENIDEEIDAVKELDTVKSTLFANV
ncbi:hypothetical protein BDV95DRAFT_602040 [Massariosphaeria phaeospora]|uniref:NAD-dependent epimerase/dehydratase domain-containing protein n=1 Tax=Massariosphaeria phaeospora TaxID=100035 RepID=A0A7C8MJ79_9PLEO|nr:hypothetical protein BDV95DRAFT_602040 [Massariosphaeria phaeospora]